MFRSLIERIASGWARPTASPRDPAPAAARAPAPASTLPDAQPTVSLAGIGARRPLLSRDGAVAGFEFRLSETLVRRAQAPARAAYTRAILTAMHSTADEGRMTLAELPASWLIALPAGDLLCPGMMVCLRPESGAVDPSSQRKAVELIRAGGARAGWHADPQGGFGSPNRPDFLLMRPNDPSSTGLAIQAIRNALAIKPRLGLIATDLPGLETVELALELGVDFASGSMAAAVEPEKAPPISPAIQRLWQLLDRLMRDEDPARLSDDIKRDVSLSVQLLRHVGSAYYARGTAVDTVEAAVLLMGRDALYRWLSRVLVRSSGARPTSRAVQDVTLARARLLELLAARRGEPHPPSFFTLGLASMLPTLLSTSTTEALRSMELAPQARVALLESDGPWFGYLELARAVERQDFEAAEGYSLAFGGLGEVLALAEEAWGWTAAQDAAH